MAEDIDVPKDWHQLAQALAAEPWQRVLVLGASDRGKSTFCRFLADRLVAARSDLTVLDTDPGQKLLGPPACVTAGPLVRPGRARIYFVGGTDPARRIGSIVAGAARLAHQAGGRLLVNTSGLVTGPGHALKRLKIDALCPDRIVAIARGTELDTLLAPVPAARICRLAPSPGARPKSAAFRAAARQQALAAALRGAHPHRCTGLVFERLDRDTPSAGKADRPGDRNGDRQGDRQGDRLCSLADADGNEHALGILREADIAAGRAVVATPRHPERIRRVRIGVLLSPETVAEVLGGT